VGHYAQYRKRGSHAPNPHTLAAPPAPTLSLVGEIVTFTANGGNDTGGRFITEESHDGGSTWSEDYISNWFPTLDENRSSFSPPSKLRTKERGNGLNYAGDSAWSNVLTI
jgi:hypothetical protein